MKKTIKSVTLFLAMTFTVGMFAETNRWPVIQPLTKSLVIVDTGSSDTPFFAIIRTNGNVPAYKIECHNGNYTDESEMNFSGSFQCALFAINGNTLTSGDLLAANTKDELSTDWWNRGRMRSAQLRGKCLRYPDYSTYRRFMLRGMLITLQFTKIRWSTKRDPHNQPLLSRFTFTFNVIPDKSVHSPRAHQIIGQKPPKACYP